MAHYINNVSRLLLSLLLPVISVSQSFSQNTDSPASRLWTLRECTDYAVEHNHDIESYQLNVENAKIDVLTAKAARYPDVSASMGQSVSNNWFNSASSKSRYGGNYGVSAGMTLYNGGSIRRNIEKSENSLKIQNLSMEKSILDLKLRIAQLYIQVLYDKETIKMKEENAAASKALWDRGLEFLKAGSMSKADVAKLESQNASDLYQITNARSQYDNDLLSLKTAMRMQRDALDIITPEISEERILEILPSRDEVFNRAMELRPEIEIGNIGIQNSELNLKGAKMGYAPRLSLSASSGTNNSSGGNFGRQLKNNWSNSLGLNLSIPIYSQRQNKSAVEKARNDLEQSKLEAEEAEDNLYTTIETVYLNARNSQQQYISAKKAYESARLSYELAVEQFKLGMKNIAEMEQERSTYMAAELSLAQSKYMALYNLQVLKFYTGIEINI
ncbi:MAG: TolC family protein [Bacteroidales bacterium]|nr:TolC family protein [Bacteroidales bacterium]